MKNIRIMQLVFILCTVLFIFNTQDVFAKQIKATTSEKTTHTINEYCQPQTAPWNCSTVMSTYDAEERNKTTLTLYPKDEIRLLMQKTQQPWLDLLIIKSSQTVLFKGTKDAVEWYSKPCIGYSNWILLMSGLQVRSELDRAFTNNTAHWQKVGDKVSADYTTSGEYTDEVFRVSLEKISDTEFTYVSEKISQKLQNPNILDEPSPEPPCARPKISDDEYFKRLKNKQPVLECQKTWIKFSADSAVKEELAELQPIGSKTMGSFSIAPTTSLPDDFSVVDWHSSMKDTPAELGQVRALKPQENQCHPPSFAW